ncbi:MAG TPA: hydantoinase B/oxoprolinase family protein [Chloroflexota bacterium]|nr:hydantoinase B/oxoprolinase family protein [Chloroflexota bacterium]
MTVDPTTLAVVRGWLQQIADEMDTVLVRSAFSTVISEQYDRACGLFEADSGGTIVQGRTGLPVFVGSMQFAVQSLLPRLRQRGVAPGDVWMLNDPYLAGTHLHDFKLVKPFFWDGRLMLYLAATGHWMDVGSSHPGGWNPRATEILQEGIRVTPVRVVRQGQLDEDVLELVLANVRLPEEARGDFEAKLSALHVGEHRLTALFQRYGPATIMAAIAELRRRSAAHVRSYIAEIPNGTYHFVDHLDDDGITDAPLRIELTLTVADTELTFDFSGSSPPCRGPYNTPAANTMTGCYIAIKHLFPDVPLNAGAFEPLHFVIPEHCFLNARFPQPHEGYLDVMCRVMDTVLGAMAQAVPERAVGAPFSTLPIFSLAGTHPATGKYYVTILIMGGGYGGSRESDGLPNAALPIGLARTAAVEVMEQRFPIRYHAFALRADSGGAGMHTGGCGGECEVELLAPEAMASNMADRTRFAPFGVQGGREGAKTEILLRQDGVVRRLTKETGIVLRQGDRITLRYPGGGGYGDPLARPPALVARDVRRGYVSRERAEREFGVVFRPGSLEIDEAATRARRGESPPVPAT